MRKMRPGFSLAEILAAVVIGSMILVAVLGIFNQARGTAAGIEKRLERDELATRVLQLISRDLDTITAPDGRTTITVENTVDRSYPSARLTINSNYYNEKNESNTLRKIIWQSAYDFEVGRFVLYRSHQGVASEDNLLYQNRSKIDRELFIPIADGLTMFQVLIPAAGNRMLQAWDKTELPHGLELSISFDQPDEFSGQFSEDQITTRTISIDRSRKTKFRFVPRNHDPNDVYQEDQEPEDTVADPNE